LNRTVTLDPQCDHAVAVRINTDKIREEAFLDGRGTQGWLGSNLIMTALLHFMRNMPAVQVIDPDLLNDWFRPRPGFGVTFQIPKLRYAPVRTLRGQPNMQAHIR